MPELSFSHEHQRFVFCCVILPKQHQVHLFILNFRYPLRESAYLNQYNLSYHWFFHTVSSSSSSKMRILKVLNLTTSRLTLSDQELNAYDYGDDDLYVPFPKRKDDELYEPFPKTTSLRRRLRRQYSDTFSSRKSTTEKKKAGRNKNMRSLSDISNMIIQECYHHHHNKELETESKETYRGHQKSRRETVVLCYCDFCGGEREHEHNITGTAGAEKLIPLSVIAIDGDNNNNEKKERNRKQVPCKENSLTRVNNKNGAGRQRRRSMLATIDCKKEIIESRNFTGLRSCAKKASKVFQSFDSCFDRDEIAKKFTEKILNDK